MSRLNRCGTLFVVVGLAGWAGPALGDEGAKTAVAPALPLCPVSGEAANLALSVATDEGPVFFCAEECIEKFKQEPAKYAEKVATQRKALADQPKVQVDCPVTGKPVDRKVFVEADGLKVYFCCRDCIKTYEADPAKYRGKLANSNTYQVTCPVMGHGIDPTSFTKLADGRRIFYCCNGCGDKLFGKPAKYAMNLAKLGYQYNWAKIRPADDKSEGAKEHGKGHDGH